MAVTRKQVLAVVLAAGIAVVAASGCETSTNRIGNQSQGGVEGVGNNTGNKMGGIT